MKNKLAKWKPYIFLAVLLASLVPLVWLGRYNYPTGDDYYYGTEAHLVWQQTGSIPQAISAACAGVAKSYQIWQGTYSALFLMYLAPNAFSNTAYHLVTFVILLLQHFLSATASGLPFSAGNMWGMDHDFLSIQFPVHPDSGLSERQLLLVQRLHVLHRFLCRDPVFPGHIASLPVQWEKDTDASASPVRNFLRRWQLRVPSPLHAVCGNRNLSTAIAEK